RLPSREAALDFGVGELNVERALGNVERDDVAIVYCGDGAAIRGFRRDMAGHESMGGAGEASVGQQSDRIAKSRADQGCGHLEHLTHSGPALRPFVADHNNIASLDASILDGGK